MYHPEGEDEIDSSPNSKVVGFTSMNADSVANPRFFGPLPQSIQHLLLDISSNDNPPPSHELGETDGKKAHTAADI
jgi:hypothetical protein